MKAQKIGNPGAALQRFHRRVIASDARWVDLYKNDPESFAKAVAYDEWVRGQRPGYKCWVHRSRTPLLQAVLALVAIADTHTTLFETDADMSASGGCEEGYRGL